MKSILSEIEINAYKYRRNAYTSEKKEIVVPVGWNTLEEEMKEVIVCIQRRIARLLNKDNQSFLGDVYVIEWNGQWIEVDDFLSENAAKALKQKVIAVLDKAHEDYLKSDEYKEKLAAEEVKRMNLCAEAARMEETLFNDFIQKENLLVWLYKYIHYADRTGVSDHLRIDDVVSKICSMGYELDRDENKNLPRNHDLMKQHFIEQLLKLLLEKKGVPASVFYAIDRLLSADNIEVPKIKL